MYDASEKLYIYDFDDYSDIIYLCEITNDTYMHDEGSRVANFFEPTLMLYSIEVFDCSKKRPKLRPSVEDPSTLELKSLHPIFDMHFWVMVRPYQ